MDPTHEQTQANKHRETRQREKQGRDRKKTTPAADSQGGLGDQESSCNYFLHYVLEFQGFLVIIQSLSFSLYHFQLACGLFFPSLPCVSCIQLLSLPWCRCFHVLLTSCFILSLVTRPVGFMFSFARFCPPVFHFSPAVSSLPNQFMCVFKPLVFLRSFVFSLSWCVCFPSCLKVLHFWLQPGLVCILYFVP